MRLRAFLYAFLLAASAAGADPASEALFKDGKAKYEAGEYVAALDSFRQAYARTKSPAAMLSIGTTLKALGRFAEAADAYEAYLADPGANPAKKAETEKALQESLKNVALFRIDAEAHAKVTVDAREAKGSVRVDPGGHVLVADDGNGPPMTTQVDVKAGEERLVSLRRKIDAPAAVASPPNERVPQQPPVRQASIPTLTYVLVGVGVVAGAAGTYFALRSRSEYDKASAITQNPATECAALSSSDCLRVRTSANDAGDANRTGAIVGLGLGVASISAGIVVALLAPKGDPPAASVLVSPGFGGLSWRQTW